MITPLSSKDEMVRITVRFGGDQAEAIRQIAKVRRTSTGSIVREALDMYLARVMETTDAPAK